MEPGLVGIVKPAVLLPQGLDGAAYRCRSGNRSWRMNSAIMRRRDNVTAAFHMAVEALFWFYPPVWLIGARLVAERERACDESVLAGGHDPEVYAGGILKVCKFCIPSPLACASGVSGADLKRRVRQIMTAPAAHGSVAGQANAAGGCRAGGLVLPVMAGFPGTPLARQAQSAVQARAEQAVTAMAEQMGMAPLAARHSAQAAAPENAGGGRFAAACTLVEAAPQPPGEAPVPDSCAAGRDNGSRGQRAAVCCRLPPNKS